MASPKVQAMTLGEMQSASVTEIYTGSVPPARAIGEFGPLTVERRAYVAAHRIAASDMHPPDTLVTPSQRQNWRVDEIARMVQEAFE